jgi:peptidoglycan/xylan/chitin deacetylase (PgdA/CDA1 family)
VRMRRLAAVAAFCAGLQFQAAGAAECPGRSDALGTERVLVVDPAAQRRVGLMQYSATLPLAHKEVVLTFDDGPLPAYTSQILQALADECAKATFFMVGRMMRAYPEWVRRVHDAGHTVATHSDAHPRRMDLLPAEAAQRELERGIAAAEAALGDRRALAPFFRFPGLRRSAAMEEYLAGRGIMAWSADIPGDDWLPISAEAVTERVLARLEQRGRGIVLLHDIQARTALALPELLRALKANGYRIVHVVPSTPGRRPTVAEPEVLVARARPRGVWPVARLARRPAKAAELAVPSALSFGFPYPAADTLEIGAADDATPPMRIAASALRLPGGSRRTQTVWPATTTATVLASELQEPGLPVPGPQSLDLSHPLASHLDLPVEAEAKPGATPRRPARTRRTAKRRHAPDDPFAGEVRLRGRIDEDTGERTWSRSLNWFH